MAGLGLVAATMALKSMGPGMYEQLAVGMAQAFQGLNQTSLTMETAGEILQHWGLIFLKVAMPFAGVLLALGLMGGVLQTRFLFTLNRLKPDFSVLNPVSGLKRLFSTRTVVEMIKSLMKLALVGTIAYRDLVAMIPAFPNLMETGLRPAVAYIATKAVGALQSIGMGMVVIGLLDYGYQYWEYRKSLRMSKQEVKQEFREQEGSPELRQKQRAKAREMALRRKAIKDVPLADVVVTNPTHYAIAIKYDPVESTAPKVLAKGSDLLAQRMKEIAKEHQVPMVENRPLARTLFATVEVGQPIPPELYQAVAEVLAFVYSLRRQQRQDHP